jgi:predicted O-methyltransferase YrrM
MAVRAKQKEDEIWGKEKVRKYAAGHKKWAGLMYSGVVKSVGEIKKTGRFLEMGAGPGFLAMMLAREYPDIKITAVDLSPDMAEVAREYIAANRLEDRISYIVGDVGDGEFMRRLGKFDLVYTTFCLHDWKPPDDAIRNLWEAVKDNGVLYLHDFRRMGFLRILPIKDKGFEAMKAAYVPGEIKTVLQKTGITNYMIRDRFPFIYLSVIARK